MDNEQTRLDILVSNTNKELTRSQAAKLISSGRVLVDGNIVIKPSIKFSDHAKIKVNIPKRSSGQYISIPIIYENDDVIVINKPAGLLSHSKGSFNDEVTVADWLNSYLGKKSLTNRDGIVHRLDRGTSGVMILAKNEEAYKWLIKQFSTRKVKKIYLAYASGKLKQPQALIDIPIERNPKKPQTFRAGSNGKASETEYKVINEVNDISLVELRPKTGRTHQLRVHLSYLGHPIIGDRFYGGKEAPRLMLHAKSLELTLPDKTRQIFEAQPPKDFKAGE